VILFQVATSARPVLERAAVLFNLAAAHCASGALLPRTDAEQIKSAARHFQATKITRLLYPS